MIDIRTVDPAQPDVARLIAFHLSGMTSNSPKDSVYALSASGLSHPDITLFGAFENGICVSIGALKKLNATDGEIKSMRTAETAVGRGIGISILKHIISSAREIDLKNLLLETGTGDSFAAAHHIYKKHGFTSCSAFGDYEQSTFNRFSHSRSNARRSSQSVSRASPLEKYLPV